MPAQRPCRPIALLLFAALLLTAAPARAEWFKGNTHCHTEFSPDSDSPIESLMGWYKANGYSFVVLTDHNAYQPAEALRALEGFDEGQGRVAPLVDDTFLLIPGEELTTSAHHVNGLDLPAYTPPGATIAQSVEAIWAEGGLPQLNHPEWSFLSGQDVVEALADLDGTLFMEVYNAHPSVVDRSGLSSADIWDAALSAGQPVWAVATDDAHTLAGGHTPPGGGFIYVEADVLTPEAILDAMSRGRLYASTGATLADFSWTRAAYAVDAPGATEIVFIGRFGEVLERVQGDLATYTFRGDELYVRAELRSPAGYAWTQPVFVGALPPGTPPRAVLRANPSRGGEAPLRVTFDGSASSDLDGPVVSWRWDFGDGAEGQGEVIAHTYTTPGRYTVALTVLDEDGEAGRATLDLEVWAPGEGPPPDDAGVIIRPEEDAEDGPTIRVDAGPGEPDAAPDTPDAAEAPEDAAAPPGPATRRHEDDGCAAAQGAPGAPLLPTLLLGAALLAARLARRRT